MGMEFPWDNKNGKNGLCEGCTAHQMHEHLSVVECQ